MKYKLDKDEQELLESLEKDKWVEVPDFAKEKKRLTKIARSTFNKNKRVNLRLNEHDFQAAHVKALAEGIPYQTLLSSIIHKYLTGRLIEQ